MPACTWNIPLAGHRWLGQSPLSGINDLCSLFFFFPLSFFRFFLFTFFTRYVNIVGRSNCPDSFILSDLESHFEDRKVMIVD